MKDKIEKTAERVRMNEEGEKNFNSKFQSNMEVIG